MAYQRVKGTEDYYPEDYAIVSAVEKVLRETAKKHGFTEVDVPVLETISSLTAKSGDEVKEQIFVMQKRSTEELGLRFDLTVPLTRMFAARQKQLPKPQKWFALAKNWRYEAPQKGRQREFTQLSAELYGSEHPEADAACINLIIDCMRAFNAEKAITIKINNRKLLEGLLLDVVNEKQLESTVKLIDKSAKITKEEFDSELKKIGVKNPDAIRKIISYRGKPSILKEIKKDNKLNEQAKKGLEELQQTLNYVDEDTIFVDLSIARGLAYYTGNVYECFDKEGKFRSLAGGGRYDNLVELYGGQPTPATGFAIGTSTLMLFLSDLGLLPTEDTGPEYYIAPLTEELMKEAITIANKLRKTAKVDIDLMRRKLSKHFDYANAIKAKNIIIIGEKDHKEGVVTIKNLALGTEKKVKIKDLN